MPFLNVPASAAATAAATGSVKSLGRYTRNCIVTVARVPAASFSTQVTLDPTSVTAQRFQSDPSLCAFVARSGLLFSRPETLKQALTHKSFNSGTEPTNERLEYLGVKIVELFVCEWANAKYPNVPPETIRDLVTAYTSEPSMAELGRELGVQDIMRWKPADPERSGAAKVLGKTMVSLIGAYYHDRGIGAARKFVHAALLAREIDVKSIMKIADPKRMLTALLRRKKMAPLDMRLLHETGRLSAAPIFVVGAFSHIRKLGEAAGSSLKMAEHRAAKDALLKYFLYELDNERLPSMMSDLPPEDEIGVPLGDTPPVL